MSRFLAHSPFHRRPWKLLTGLIVLFTFAAIGYVLFVSLSAKNGQPQESPSTGVKSQPQEPPSTGVPGGQMGGVIGGTIGGIITSVPTSLPTATKPSSAKPVYNAVFSPTREGTNAVLLDGRVSSVNFFIGPRRSRSAVQADNEAVNPALIAEEQDVQLNITMICLFCLEPKVQKSEITYSGKKRVSTHARFEFVPQRSTLENEAGIGKIAFQITRLGSQIDYVSVAVTVAQSRVDNPSSTRVLVGRGKSVQTQPRKWTREVDLLVQLRPNGNLIEVQLEPAAELQQLFGVKNLDENGKATKWLRTGLTVSEVRGIVGSFYVTLKSIIDNNQKLRALLTGSRTTQPAISDVLLSDEDKRTLLLNFANTGGLVYRKLFITGCEADLRDMMASVDAYTRKDRAVRIRIDSQSLYFPWQVLTPPGNIDPNAFWGFRYELSVNPTGTILPGPFQGPLLYRRGPLLFGQYRGNKTDDVARLAIMELQFLQTDLRLEGISVADSPDAFLQRLTSNRRTLQLLLTFTHARSGTTIKENGEAVEDVAGPQLEFADHEYVTAKVLNDMLAQLPKQEVSLLPNGPVVFLNGCETGTAGFYATTNLDFAGIFLAMGSRGVIVTEAPVWTYFGYNFGISLVRQLKAGDPIPLALLKLRKEYLLKANNPLGLLYSYYGGPDVSVEFLNDSGPGALPRVP